MRCEYEYIEEDGWAFVRNAELYYVYGRCTGVYNYQYADGDNVFEQEDFNCFIECVCNSDGEEVDITLTPQEYEAYKQWMLYLMEARNGI